MVQTHLVSACSAIYTCICACPRARCRLGLVWAVADNVRARHFVFVDGIRAEKQYCENEGLPEKQHTGGILEVLGWAIAVACLWRKFTSSKITKSHCVKCCRRRLNVVTKLTSRHNIGITCTPHIEHHFTIQCMRANTAKEDLFNARRSVCSLGNRGAHSSRPCFLPITSSKAANLSNCA